MLDEMLLSNRAAVKLKRENIQAVDDGTWHMSEIRSLSVEYSLKY